jgi:hypothetical protein
MAVHAANPAPGPIDLETLIDRATRPLPRRLPDPPPLPRAPPAARIDPPRAIVLVTTVATCQSCGTVYRMPNNAILVRYDDAGLSNSIHYKRADIERDLFRALPRERKDHSISVPICEGCFDVEPNPLLPVNGQHHPGDPNVADPDLDNLFVRVSEDTP